MAEQDDSYKIILTSFEDEYEETHDPVWVWHAMDFCSTWQRKTGTKIPYPQWVTDYLSAVAGTLLKLNDEKDDVSGKIIELIGIREHSISASVKTIRDKVLFFEIQSMIKAGILVGADKFRQIVDANIFLIGIIGRIMFEYDAAGVYINNHGVTLRNNGHTGISGHNGFDARADQRRLTHQQRHRLTLHVRAHQSAVGIIVLKEGNQRCSDRYHLLG